MICKDSTKPWITDKLKMAINVNLTWKCIPSKKKEEEEEGKKHIVHMKIFRYISVRVLNIPAGFEFE